MAKQDRQRHKRYWQQAISAIDTCTQHLISSINFCDEFGRPDLSEFPNSAINMALSFQVYLHIMQRKTMGLPRDEMLRNIVDNNLDLFYVHNYEPTMDDIKYMDEYRKSKELSE